MDAHAWREMRAHCRGSLTRQTPAVSGSVKTLHAPARACESSTSRRKQEAGVRTLLGEPVPLDVRLLTLLRNELEGVHAKPCARGGPCGGVTSGSPRIYASTNGKRWRCAGRCQYCWNRHCWKSAAEGNTSRRRFGIAPLLGSAAQHMLTIHVAVIGRYALIAQQVRQLQRKHTIGVSNKNTSIHAWQANCSRQQKAEGKASDRQRGAVQETDTAETARFYKGTQERTMLQDSGWWDRKSSTRQPSCTCFRGLGLRECTRSGNLMPSRMKNTGMSLPANAGPERVSGIVANTRHQEITPAKHATKHSKAGSLATNLN